MKHETIDLYLKYKYILELFTEEREELFINDPNLERFFDTYNMIICFHWRIKKPYKYFNRRRNELMKKFNYGLYELLLKEFFCDDISSIILSFIIKV